jgi:Uma2 family endonuclease
MASVVEILVDVRRTKITEKRSPSVRLLTVCEYDKMIEAGIFGEDDRVELLEGVLLQMSPKGTKHQSSTDRATRLFIQRLGDRVHVRNQGPIHLDDYSEPEPDIVLAAPDVTEYADHHPAPHEIFVVIEVSDTTLAYDRDRKCLLYAKAGIPHYLMLNVEAREIEDYRDPSSDGYRSKQTLKEDQNFSLLAFPEITISVSELLPPKGSEAS